MGFLLRKVFAKIFLILISFLPSPSCPLWCVDAIQPARWSFNHTAFKSISTSTVRPPAINDYSVLVRSIPRFLNPRHSLSLGSGSLSRFTHRCVFSSMNVNAVINPPTTTDVNTTDAKENCLSYPNSKNFSPHDRQIEHQNCVKGFGMCRSGSLRSKKNL